MKRKEHWMFQIMNLDDVPDIKIAENGIPAPPVPVPPVGDL